MLKTQPFVAIFLLDDKENVSSFQTARNIWTKKRNFHDFSMTSATFPKFHDLFQVLKPGGALSNSMTFHDFSYCWLRKVQ